MFRTPTPASDVSSMQTRPNNVCKQAKQNQIWNFSEFQFRIELRKRAIFISFIILRNDEEAAESLSLRQACHANRGNLNERSHSGVSF